MFVNSKNARRKRCFYSCSERFFLSRAGRMQHTQATQLTKMVGARMISAAPRFHRASSYSSANSFGVRALGRPTTHPSLSTVAGGPRHSHTFCWSFKPWRYFRAMFFSEMPPASCWPDTLWPSPGIAIPDQVNHLQPGIDLHRWAAAAGERMLGTGFPPIRSRTWQIPCLFTSSSHPWGRPNAAGVIPTLPYKTCKFLIKQKKLQKTENYKMAIIMLYTTVLHSQKMFLLKFCCIFFVCVYFPEWFEVEAVPEVPFPIILVTKPLIAALHLTYDMLGVD